MSRQYSIKAILKAPRRTVVRPPASSQVSSRPLGLNWERLPPARSSMEASRLTPGVERLGVVEGVHPRGLRVRVAYQRALWVDAEVTEGVVGMPCWVTRSRREETRASESGLRLRARESSGKPRLPRLGGRK